jgi:hypothetical protein
MIGRGAGVLTTGCGACSWGGSAVEHAVLSCIVRCSVPLVPLVSPSYALAHSLTRGVRECVPVPVLPPELGSVMAW